MVKTSLRPLSKQEFVNILNGQFKALLKGGTLEDIDDFRVSQPFMRGSAFIDIISCIRKFVLPAVGNFLAPATTNFAHGLVDNISQGKNLKRSLKIRGQEGLKRIGTLILSGKGKRTSNIKSVSLLGSGGCHRRRRRRAKPLRDNTKKMLKGKRKGKGTAMSKKKGKGTERGSGTAGQRKLKCKWKSTTKKSPVKKRRNSRLRGCPRSS